MNRTRLSVLFAATLVATACSDDDKNIVDTRDDGGLVTGERDGGGLPGADGSLDGQVIDIDAFVVLPDGQVVLPDGAAVLPDGATADGATADGASPADGSLSDGSLDGAGPCDVNDPKYGCGTLSGTTWISFPDFEVDLTNNVAWTKPVTVVDDDELAGICPTLTAGGFAWKLPQMEDVRKLAAGCPETLPDGSCNVYLDEVVTANAGDCDCDPGLVGPNDGKFCRPEVPECETFWVWTHTYETGFYQHWFYDVKTGSIVPEYVGINIALEAKGRCVHDLDDSELPAFDAP
ncbi:MAG TPA: hypothetical protein VFX59_25630 [Polyangiales bacterium]|nr:hypothetical protein [Polyangiales bacterium]